MADDPIYEYDLFISYNRTDEEWARKLAARVERERWQGRPIKVFFAPWDIRPGESVDERLDRALSETRYVGLVLSPESVASQWVSEEWHATHHIGMKKKERRLIPLYLRVCEIPPFLNHLHRIDFRDEDNFDEGIRLLLAVIREEPLPRGDQQAEPKAVAPPPIPRPPVVGFVARRDAEGHDIVGRLRDELVPQKSQLVVLWGAGGVGKTTLAAEAVRAMAGVFGSRVVWSSAKGRADYSFSTLLDEIAAQLDRADLRPLTPEQKAERLRPVLAEAPALVVLDNFETVAPAEQARCVEFLLSQAPCPVLITTRERIPQARSIRIATMSVEEALEYLPRLIEQTGDPSVFARLDRERILAASERNPLVLQWVVAQIGLALDPDAVLDDLTQGAGDAAQHVFDRSFNLPQLTDDGRAGLLALSLFAPSASRPALAFVAGFGDDEARLNEAVKHLAALWLVKAAAEGKRLTVEGLTYQLAKARLSRDEHADDFRQRFVAYFLSYAEAHAQQTPEDFDALEAEKDNVLGAMDVAFQMKNWDGVMRIRNALEDFLGMRGYWNEAIQRGKQAVAAAQEANNEEAVAVFALNVAKIRQRRGEYDEARQAYQQTITAFRKLKSEINIAVGLHNLAILAQAQGELDEARRLYNESLEIEKKLGNQRGIASTLHELGKLAQNQGELEEARRLYDESLEIAKKLGDQSGIAITLHQLGQLAENEGNKEEAARLFREALIIFEKLKSPNAEVARRSLKRVGGEAS